MNESLKYFLSEKLEKYQTYVMEFMISIQLLKK